MKTVKLISLPILFFILLSSFNSQNSFTQFDNALGEKKIEIEILPTGGYSGNCINIKVKNISSRNLNLEMMAGTIFIPEDTGEQTLVTEQNHFLVLNKNEEKLFKIFAYCTMANNSCPSQNSKFKISQTQNTDLKKLLTFLDSTKMRNDNTIQQSIWCVTDHESASDIFDADASKAQAIQKYVCTLTHQIDPWYTTKREISVDANRSIVRTAKEVTGEITYESSTASEIQGMVLDSAGNVVTKNPNKTVCPAGKITFDFDLKVNGWKPGNYNVVYTNNGVEILRKPFSL